MADPKRIDIHSPTWIEVSAWATALLASLRTELESPQTGHDRSQIMRGEIKTLKALIELPTAEAPKVLPSVDYIA